jgi:hypothetical protein
MRSYPSFEVTALQPHALDDALMAKEKIMPKVSILLASVSSSKRGATFILSCHQAARNAVVNIETKVLDNFMQL